MTTRAGFADASTLGPTEPRAAVVLTFSGSLLWLGAPEGPAQRRRYVYQSIYGTGAPREGDVALLEPVRPGQPVTASRLTTSPVRRLRVSTSSPSWQEHKRTLAKLIGTLASFAERSAPIAAPAKLRSVYVADARQLKEDQALARLEQIASDELADLLDRLLATSGPEHDPLEAEVVGQIIHLARLSAERGRPACPTGNLGRFETVDDEVCLMKKGAIEVERPTAKPLRVEKGSIGGDQVVVGAPAALLDARGCLVAVLGCVRAITRK